MKVKFERVHKGDLSDYKSIFSEYNPEYIKKDDEHYVIIELKDINELFYIAKSGRRDFLISGHGENCVIVLDDYLD